MSNRISETARLVYDFALRNNLFCCENIVVGLSGGPDSVALLSILNELKNNDCNFPNITAVHVNHLYRDDAFKDEEFCKELCLKMNVEFISYQVDVLELSKENHKSFEEMGRIKRYELLNEVASKKNNSLIAIAHHKDDIAETMMMNLFRGSGLEGLTSPRAKNGNLIRPLLCVAKSDIYTYLSEMNLSYSIDSTNMDSDTTRNKWRNDVLPLVNEVSLKNPSDALADTYELLSEDLKLIESIVADAYSERLICIGDYRLLDCNSLSDNMYSIKSRLIRKLWLDTFGNLTDFMKIHVDAVLKFLDSNSSGVGRLDLPFSRNAIKLDGKVAFCDSGSENDLLFEYARSKGYILSSIKVDETIIPNKTTKIPNTSIYIKADIVENSSSLEYNNLSWIYPVSGDASNIELHVRNEIKSMLFKKAGSNCGKKLGDVLSDKHIPAVARNSVLGICLGDDLLWVPGLGHSKGVTNSVSYERFTLANPDFDGKFLRISFYFKEN